MENDPGDFGEIFILSVTDETTPAVEVSAVETAPTVEPSTSGQVTVPRVAGEFVTGVFVASDQRQQEQPVGGLSRRGGRKPRYVNSSRRMARRS